jgi:hypothetical protein
MSSVIFVILSSIFHCYSTQPFPPATVLIYFATLLIHFYSHRPFYNFVSHFPLLQYSSTFQSYSAQSFVILSAILEPRRWEAARARARGSIACGLAAQSVMCAGPSHAFNGVTRGTGSRGHEARVGHAPVSVSSVSLGGPLGRGDGPSP